MAGLRYLYYVAFVIAALVLWTLYFMLVLGISPVPAEPACSLDSSGCSRPTWIEHLMGVVSIFGAIPFTTLLFVFFRRRVRRLFGLDAD